MTTGVPFLPFGDGGHVPPGCAAPSRSGWEEPYTSRGVGFQHQANHSMWNTQNHAANRDRNEWIMGFHLVGVDDPELLKAGASFIKVRLKDGRVCVCPLLIEYDSVFLVQNGTSVEMVG